MGFREQCEHQDSQDPQRTREGSSPAAGQRSPMPCRGGHDGEPEQPTVCSAAREALCAPGGQDPL